MKKFLYSILIFIVLFGVIITAFGFKLHNGIKFSNLNYELRWSDFYSNNNDLDYLFIGSSHCYRSFIPSVIDSINRSNSFNLGSSSQSTLTSYYVLQEALRNRNIKEVVLEVYPGTLSISDNYTNALYNIDNIKSLDIKLSLMLTVSNYSDLIEVALPAYRYNNYLSTLYKKTNVDATVKHGGLTSKYFDRGYVITKADTSFSFKSEFEPYIINTSTFSERMINSITKISNLCKDKDVKLILVTQTLNPKYFDKIRNYESFHNLIDSIALKNNIRYIDGNYRNNEIGLTYKDYYDSGHMLYSGAIKFSTWVAKELKNPQSPK